jgi:hypothetical protein
MPFKLLEENEIICVGDRCLQTNNIPTPSEYVFRQMFPCWGSVGYTPRKYRERFGIEFYVMREIKLTPKGNRIYDSKR